MRKSHAQTWPSFLLVMIVAVASTGCSTLPSSLSAGALFSEQAVATRSADADGSKPLYMVDVQMPFSGKKHQGTIDAGATVQTALEQSGAAQKFRKMNVSVLRKVKGEYKPLKMACEFDTTLRSVVPSTDYALQHGDRIVVTPQTDGGVLQMLGKIGEGK